MKIFRFMLAVVVLVTAAGTRAGAGGYFYCLNSSGAVTVNGNKISGLPGSFNPDLPDTNTEQAWRDLAVVDGQQYAIRADGRVVLNGSRIWQLPFGTVPVWYWTNLKVTGNTTYALREDGNLAVNGSVVATLPRGNFYFTALSVLNSATYALRSDGAVFKNSVLTALFTFSAGNDGESVNKLWIALLPDPSGEFLYALRTDGILYRGLLPAGDKNGELVETLPFPVGVYTTGDLYQDFTFDSATGDWLVLRVNGKIYREPDALQEIVDLPGSGTVSGEFYVDIEFFDGRYFALRSSGNVYVESLADPLAKLTGSSYGRIILSDIPPDLAGVKNNTPNVVLYTVPINTDQPIKIPVIATDVETPTAELVVTPVTVPVGAVWDAPTQTLTWTTPAVVGKYNFAYSVADGAGSNTYSSTIQVKLPDSDPAKNKPPYLPKLKGCAALTDHEYRVYIPLNDPDGDPVTATVDTATYPFNEGATYNPVTSEFTWTSTITDLGNRTAVFTLSDGITSKRLKLKIEVKSPLFIPPLP